MKLILSFFLLLSLYTSLATPQAIYMRQLDSVQSVYESEKDPAKKLIAAFTLADLEYFRSPADALTVLDSTESFIRKNKMASSLTNLFIARGEFYFKMADLPEAIDYYQQALHFAQYHNHSELSPGWPYMEIGNFFYKISEFNMAFRYFDNALQIFRKEGKPFGIAVAYNNMGLAQMELGHPLLAELYFKNALEIRVASADSLLIAQSEFYLARAKIASDQKEKADILLLSAQELLNQSINLQTDTEILHTAALAHLAAGNFKKAISLLSRSLQLHARQGKEYNNSTIYLQLSRIYAEQEKWQIAEESLKLGMAEAKKYHRYDQYEEMLSYMVQLLKQQNKTDETLKTALQLLHFKDSIQQFRNQIFSDVLHIHKEWNLTEEKNLVLEDKSEAQIAELKQKERWIWGMSFAIIAFLLLLVILFSLNNKYKQSTATHHENHRRIMAIINNTENIILSIKKDGLISLINKAGEDFYKQLCVTDLRIGYNLLERLYIPGHRETWEDWLEKGKHELSWREISEVKIAGKMRYFYKNFTAIYDEKGEFDGLVMVAADFTEQRHQQMVIENSRNELQKSDTAKQKMISILAHDLKDAIYSTKALAEMVNKDPEANSREELLGYFELLQENFTKTANLLEGMLSWVKAQSAGLKLIKENIELQKLAAEEIENIKERALVKEINILSEIPENHIISADREALKTILRNLLSNAVKYTPALSGKIIMRSEKVADKIRVSVVDNGVGISERDLENIFSRPGNISRPGTDNEKGTGFGINLCEDLLKFHGSKLEIRSIPGKGSTFYFLMPCAQKIIHS